MTAHTEAIQALLRSGPRTAAELGSTLGISQPTVSRALTGLSEDLIRIGRARSARYALAAPLGRVGSHWPLYRLTPLGRPDLLGELHRLQGGGWFLQPAQPLPLFLHGEFADGLYPDLPWFLDDLRPQGFLGRAFVNRHATELEAPSDIAQWRAEDVITALLRRGSDLSGNLVLGEAALERALRDTLQDNPETTIQPDLREFFYPQRAIQAEAGEVAGSSAGGEQPKFTAELQRAPGERESVIVKFARHDPDNATARRWVNLLVCEHLAAGVLSEHGIAAATSELIDSDGWRFLQSTRFDRTAQRGRVGVASMRALDAAYAGSDPGDWSASAAALLSEGLIDENDAEHIRRLQLFGRFIGNTDMHFGNLSFHSEPDRLLVSLTPVYDMLPMHYRPGAGGAVHDRPYDLPLPVRDLEHWRWAAVAARTLWERAASDARIGPAFRAIAADNAARIAHLLQRFGE
ncbi:MAG: type II toxin-antitoxin system HipA family toxin YjjJ [Lysobacter sp.]